MANRLADEPSPYLQQHAENPVDWYPWGEEAFRRAREEDRPILLSIGYSACHWCHVMERESFSDPQVAEVLNREFVPVKVDREERPDVDSIYMRAVQALTGHGGWPLTAFLTPDGKPFHAGTYFPPERRHGIPSFTEVLRAASGAYHNRRDEVDELASQLRGALERSTLVEPGGEGPEETEEAISDELLGRAAQVLMANFDPINGGFGGAPKFPQPLVLDYLLRHHQRTGDRQSLQGVVHTLRRMARGGIHDQIGGGFHRYSVDQRWLVPHFEKMLYDNGLLARVYLDAYRVTGEEELARVARGILDYVLDDLRSPDGGFYSARDADSPNEAGEPEEGAFYVWEPRQVDEVLGSEDGALFRECFDVTEQGNFEGRNILHLPHDLEAMARSRGMEPDELAAKLRELGAKLLEARGRREPPFRDEKVLAGWNGYVLRALAEAGAALDEPGYTDRAREGAGFVLESMRRDDRLLRVWKDGTARIHGFLEDYGSMGNALLTLHETTGEPGWLQEAVWCADRALDLFFDEGQGIFFDAPSDGEKLVVRPRDSTDTATPSGQSLAVELLARLTALTEREWYGATAARVIRAEADNLGRIPAGFGRLLAAGAFQRTPLLELAVVGPREDEGARELLGLFHRSYRPHRVVAGWDPERDAPAEEGARLTLPDDVPLLAGREARNGVATAYACRFGTCRAPATTPGELEEELRALEQAGS